jgi:hypothetical protein
MSLAATYETTAQPNFSWALKQSTDPGVLEVLRTNQLDPDELDIRLQLLKERVFVSHIYTESRKITFLLDAVFNPSYSSPASIERLFSKQLLTIGSSKKEIEKKVALLMNFRDIESPSLLGELYPLIDAVRNPKGPKTVAILSNLVSTLLQIQPGNQMTLVTETIELLTTYLSQLATGLTSEKKALDDINTNLTLIKSIWRGAASWCQTMQQQPTCENLQIALTECVKLVKDRERILSFFAYELQSVALQGSRYAFQKYEQKIIKLSLVRCFVCKKANDLRGTTPFETTLEKCSNCEKILYCSNTCRIKDLPRHKPDCVYTSL